MLKKLNNPKAIWFLSFVLDCKENLAAFNKELIAKILQMTKNYLLLTCFKIYLKNTYVFQPL